MTISWTEPSKAQSQTDQIQYRVRYCGYDVDNKQIGDCKIAVTTNTTFTFDGLRANQTYEYFLTPFIKSSSGVEATGDEFIKFFRHTPNKGK